MVNGLFSILYLLNVKRDTNMFQILYYLVKLIQPVLIPICFVFAWIFLILLAWSIVSGIRDTTARAKKMHEIPCSNCDFFTNDYRLKCTVDPISANTELALKCKDYTPKLRK